MMMMMMKVMMMMMMMMKMIHLAGGCNIDLLNNVVDNAEREDDSDEERHRKHNCEYGASNI